MDNLETYNSNSGFGECYELETKIIEDFFKHTDKKVVQIKRCEDKDMQFAGIDYMVALDDGSIKTIDMKIHHYRSDVFVFEYGDTRPNYRNRSWGQIEAGHSSDFIIWVTPFNNTYTVYTYKTLLAFKESDEWKKFKNEPFMNVEHKKYNNLVGTTYNKWLPTNFTKLIGVRPVRYTYNMDLYILFGKVKLKDNIYTYLEDERKFIKRSY